MADTQTFAFNAPPPVQGGLDSGGGYRGIDIQGVAVRTGNASPAGGNDFGGQFGEYLDNLMKPYAERKARERFIQGMTDQMYAEAGHEIRAGNGIFTKIFGPSAYEEGAIFYEGRAKAAQAQAEWQSREDELKTLSPNEVAQQWAGLLDKTKTGDPFTDDTIEKSMLEASGPMLQSVAKARYTWQQQTTVKNQQVAWDSGASAYQAQAASFASTASPNEEQVNGYNLATTQFLQGMAQPAGQDDESYIKSLTNSFNSMVTKGNGHAASALMASGILNILKPEDRARLDSKYESAGHKALNEAAADPAVADAIDTLNGQIAFGQLTGKGITEAMSKVNEQLKRKTGFNVDYFDASDQETASKGVWAARKSALERAESRQWQIEDEQTRQAFELQKQRQQAQVEASAADAAWQSKNPGSAMVAGVVKNDTMQARAYKGYQDKDWDGLDRAFKSGVVGSQVKQQIQSTVGAAIYSGYSQEFEGLHQNFTGMMATDPAVAKEYFGPTLFPAMLHYNKLQQQGATPAVAFAMAFGDDVQYSADGTEVYRGRKEVEAWAKENGQPGLFSRIFAGETKLNDSGAKALANYIGREYATDNRYSSGDLSANTLMATAMTRARANGAFEKYGPLGWSNREGTQPLYRIMQMQPQEAGQIIPAVIDLHLKNVGYKAGVNGDEYHIVRGSQSGKGVTMITPATEDGGVDFAKTVVISDDEFVNAGREYRKRRVSGYTPDAHQQARNRELERAEYLAKNGAAALARRDQQVAAEQRAAAKRR